MIKKIEAVPYKLTGKIQNYEWGTKNQNAYIAKFLGIEAEKNIPYAEYWIGIHPKAPSDIIVDGEIVSLSELLHLFPKEILGERVADKFNNKLPFLLKILSINKALSIQSHPSKELAKELHQKDPNNYPDDNHKPEIAIAIDNLKAIVGLKSLNEIKNVIDENPEIKLLLNDELMNRLEKNQDYSEAEIIKQLYSQIMHAPEDKLEKCILSLSYKFRNKAELNDAEEQFLIQFKNFGTDIGLLSLLLFNLINLKSGEAIFTPAGIPHAYISGNIVECMANSDNVVRAGLTPKFKDIKTLTEMLEVDSTQSIVDIRETDDKIIYKTSAEEFEIELLKLENKLSVKDIVGISILLIIKGQISLNLAHDKKFSYSRGEVILLPASLKEFSIHPEKPSIVYRAKVPT